MEIRAREAEVAARSPDGGALARVVLTGERVTVGRLAEANDIALLPDPQRLVSRANHCAFERRARRWVVVDGGSVNGTFLRRGETLQRVSEPTALRDGEVVCVLAEVTEAGERRYFELAFREAGDSQATRAAPLEKPPGSDLCLRYDVDESRLVLVLAEAPREVPIRAQAHRLVRHMAGRNAAANGSAVLCTHDELMHAVWGDEPMHSREELAKLFWELRRKLEPFGAAHLIESERRLGYRLRTCGD